MGVITEKPKYDAIDNWRVILKGDLCYYDNQYIIRVYSGFITDGGSLPRFSWSILGITPFSPICVYAFFIHDFLYASHLLTRKQSDKILWDILGLPPACNKAQRWLIWVHVRLYGWLAWKSSPEFISEARKFGEITRKRALAPMVIK